MSPAELYEADFYEWIVRNAQLLREGRASEADLANIAEELEGMAKKQRRELLSRLSSLIAHLLKWQVQPERRSRSWSATIRFQRIGLCKLLTEMPSLRRSLEASLAEAYQDAVVLATAETGYPEDGFPDSCPFAFEALLDQDYLP